jgi:DNA-binding MurR/RpiR family transcriptional regulator
LPGVVVSARTEGSKASINSTSDDKGVWVVAGMAKGDWQVDFDKSGYEQRHAKVILPVELAKVPVIAITMKKAS